MRSRLASTLRLVSEEEDFDGILAARLERSLSQVISEKQHALLALGAEEVLRGFRIRLAAEHRSGVRWPSVHLFMTYEYCTLGEGTQSAFETLAYELVKPLDIPPENVHRIRSDVSDITAEARRYEELVVAMTHVRTTGRLLDICLLALNPDGSVGGLRAESEGIVESDRYVLGCRVSRTGGRGVSLTVRALNSCASVWIAAKGEEVAPVLHDILEGDFEPSKYPVQVVRPRNGELLWVVDAEAAQRLGVASKLEKP